MKTNFLFKSILTIIFFTITFSSCEDVDELIDELQISREFAPVDLRAFIRNQTIIELNWNVNDNISSYLVEFSEDQDFNTISASADVTGNQLPFQIQLNGETLYYIRVKGRSARGLDDSIYVFTSATTLTEQIFLPIQPGDILATEATLRWVPNSTVTQITITPGDIVYNITPQNISDGFATIPGLTGETEYTAKLLNNTAIRGLTAFTTGIDIGDGTLVTPEDDLFQMIADASPGDILVLEGGDYTAQVGTATLDKTITIRGLQSFNKPLLRISFSIVGGATDVELIDLDLTGDTPTDLTDVVRYTGAGNFNSLLISGCNIHDYNRSFIAGNASSAIVQNVTVENSIVTNILTSGGDFIDFRNSDVLNLNINTSTFANCAPGRDFIRIDAAGVSNNTGQICNVLLDSCTLYQVSNNSSRRVLYVRFNSNSITVRNNIIAESAGKYSNQSTTDPNTTFINNNYFNASLYTDAAETLFDSSVSATNLDPGFTNAMGGNFTISNQTLIDNGVGDPRWRQ